MIFSFCQLALKLAKAENHKLIQLLKSEHKE